MPPPLDALAALAEEVGLELRGTLAAEPLPDTDPELPARLEAWLAAGYQGDMPTLNARSNSAPTCAGGRTGPAARCSSPCPITGRREASAAAGASRAMPWGATTTR